MFFGGGDNICFAIAESDSVCNPETEVLELLTQAGDPTQDTVSSGNCGAVALQD